MDELKPCFEASKISKTYSDDNKQTRAIEEVSFEAAKGEAVSIVGPTGCGKSTLLRILAGLEKPTTGAVKFDGEPLDVSRVGFVFQSPLMFPWRNIRQNVEYGLEVRGVSKEERGKIASSFLRMVGLTDSDMLLPKMLSGGMLQRACLARALAVNSDVILMDEAFSSLDEFTAGMLKQQVAELKRLTEKTWVFVTHNIAEAIQLSEKVVVLSSKPARVKKIIDIPNDQSRDQNDEEFVRIHRSIFEMLQEQFEISAAKQRIRSVAEFQSLPDMEAD